MPLRIEAAVLRDNTLSDTPLRIMQQTDYDYLPSKASPTNISDPTAIYYESGLTNGTLYTDCAACVDTSKFIVLTYLETVQDVNTPTDNFEYPQEWYLPLALGLSKQIAPMFSATWSSLQETNLATALAIAQHKDAEITTLFFQPGEEP